MQSPRETPACTVGGVAREAEGYRAMPGWRPCAAGPADEAAKLPGAREVAEAASRRVTTPSALTDQEDSAPPAVTASQPAAVTERVVAAGDGSAAAHPAAAAVAQPLGRVAAEAASDGLPQTEEAEAAERSRAVQKLMSQVLRAVPEDSQASHVVFTETGESLAKELPVQAVLESREASAAASAVAEEPSHEGQHSAEDEPEQHSDAHQTCRELPGTLQQQKLATLLLPSTCAVDPAVLKAEGVSKPAVAITPAAWRHGELAPAPVSGTLKAEPQQNGVPLREPEDCSRGAAQAELVPASAQVDLAQLPAAAAGLKAEVGAQQGRGKLSAACMVLSAGIGHLLLLFQPGRLGQTAQQQQLKLSNLRCRSCPPLWAWELLLRRLDSVSWQAWWPTH